MQMLFGKPFETGIRARFSVLLLGEFLHSMKYEVQGLSFFIE